MASNPKVTELCNAIRFAGLPLEGTVDGKGKIIPPYDPDFDLHCRSPLELLLTVNPAYPIWNRILIDQAGNFARRHNVTMTMKLPDYQSPAGFEHYTSKGNTIYLGLVAPVTESLSQSAFMLEHELGHIRQDARFLGQYDPKLKDLFEKEKTTRAEAIYLIQGLLTVLAAHLTNTEKKEFQKRANPIFGPLKKRTSDELGWITVMLVETLRYGEEQFNPRMPENTLSFCLLYFTQPNGQALNSPPFVRTLTAAYLQQAGLWEKITSHPHYNAASITPADWEQIRFFRMAIHGAALWYYPGVASPLFR